MAERSLHHIHLFCRDMESMIRFWDEILNARYLRPRTFGGCPGADLDIGIPSAVLSLKQVASCTDQNAASPRSGLDHLGLCVPDLQALLDKVQAHPLAGIHTPMFETETHFCAFISGPEGILIEVMQAK